MIFNRLAKISGNSLFSPAILLFSLFLGYIFTTLDFVGKGLPYTYILVLACFILSLKIFILGFGSIETSLIAKKGVLTGIYILLTVGQFIATLLATDRLTQETSLYTSFQLLLVANLAFFIHSFLVNNISALKVSIGATVFYGLAIFALYHKWLLEVPTNFLLFQQFLAYSVLLIETILFFIIIRKYVSNRK